MRNVAGTIGHACRGLAVISVLWAAGGVASAQSQQQKKPDEPVLKGPAVKERSVPGVVNSFGQSQEGRRMAERIPPEVLREALGVLTADDAPAEIRASAEQEAEFKTVTDELRGAVRKYMAEHRDELIELRKDANLSGRAAQEIDRAIGGRPGAAGGGGGKGEKVEARRERAKGQGEGEMADAPKPMDEAAEARQEAARQRLRELMGGAPKIEDYMTRVWEKLSPAQREAVDSKLNEYRKREAKKREEMYVKQRVSEKQPDGAPRRPAAGAAPAADEDMLKQGEKAAAGKLGRPNAPARPNVANAQRRERLMQLFEKLSPEQQEMLLERLENVAREGGFGGPGRPRGQRPPQNADKPAPGMEDVDVPKPEDVEKDTPPTRPRKRLDPA